MTNMTQENTGRNTSNGPGFINIRSRNWAFTFNNHNKEDIDMLKHTFSSDNKILKWRFQEEKSKTGTLHLQGTVAYRNAVSLQSIKKINNKIHWERCRNLAASLNYCKKKETRCGNIFESDNLKSENSGHELTYQEELDHIRKQNQENQKEMVKRLIKLDKKIKEWHPYE